MCKDTLGRLSALFRGDMNVNILVPTGIESGISGIEQYAVYHATLALSYSKLFYDNCKFFQLSKCNKNE